MQSGEENEALKSLPSIVVALGDGKRFEGARRERNLIEQAKKKKGKRGKLVEQEGRKWRFLFIT